jgi:4-amino-4-deoxy-L-arabinose transferase-like glycosyltransferase
VLFVLLLLRIGWRQGGAEIQDGGRGTLLLIALVSVLGGAIRSYGINFGLPDLYHPDELGKAEIVRAMIRSGSWNPNYFQHPSLLLTLTALFASALADLGLVGRGIGGIVLSGRVVSLVAGTIAIPLLYCVGAIASGRRTGVLAATLLAVAPLHITCSRYLKEDALLVTMALLATLCILRALRNPARKELLLAGVTVGLASGTKYSALALWLLLPLIPSVSARNYRPSGPLALSAALALLSAVIGFLIATPYALLDFSGFIAGVRYERDHLLGGHDGAISVWSQLWTYHVVRTMPPAISILTTGLAWCGVGLLARRAFRDHLPPRSELPPYSTVLFAIFLLFYLPAEWAPSKPAPQPERYLMAALPFLLLGAGAFVGSLALRTQLLLMGCALTLMTTRSVTLASHIAPDTRVQMANWIRERVPKGSTILIDRAPYSAALRKRDAIRREHIEHPLQLTDLGIESLKARKVDFLLLSGFTFDRYFTEPGAPIEYREAFKRIFNTFPVVHAIADPAGEYGFHNPPLFLLSMGGEPTPLTTPTTPVSSLTR